MAVITQDQVTRVYTEPGARVRSLFEVRDVSGGDTVDLAALGFYRNLKQAAWMAVTVLGVASANITAPATVSETWWLRA